jgi:hypothetical protein
MADDIKALLYWCKEREKIRLRKEYLIQRATVGGVGEPPAGSKDEILAAYRFCNVHRADDRVSHWLRDNVLTSENLNAAGLENFLMFSAWCRWVNWPPTIKAAMEAGFFPSKEINWAKLGKFVDDLAKEGKVWTGAYMIRAPKKKGGKKGRFIAVEVIGKHFKRLLPKLVDAFTGESNPLPPTYRQIWQLLQTAENFGSFMSGQVAGDWTYTALLRDAPDLKTWAPMGPGSIRGFNRIIGNPKIRQRPDEDVWQEKLQKWRAAIVKKLGPAYGETLTALDVQNCLCEVDKYLRVKNGEGRPRAKYTPHTY